MDQQTNDRENAEIADTTRQSELIEALGAEVHCAKCGYLHTLPAGSCHPKICKVVVRGCENCGCTEPMLAEYYNVDGNEIKYSHYPTDDMVVVGTYDVSL